MTVISFNPCHTIVSFQLKRWGASSTFASIVASTINAVALSIDMHLRSHRTYYLRSRRSWKLWNAVQTLHHCLQCDRMSGRQSPTSYSGMPICRKCYMCRIIYKYRNRFELSIFLWNNCTQSNDIQTFKISTSNFTNGDLCESPKSDLTFYMTYL